MTALLAIAAGAIPVSVVFGFVVGGHFVSLSARDRIAAALRAQDRAICAAEDAQAEAAHWRDCVATPAALMLSRPESR